MSDFYDERSWFQKWWMGPSPIDKPLVVLGILVAVVPQFFPGITVEERVYTVISAFFGTMLLWLVARLVWGFLADLFDEGWARAGGHLVVILAVLAGGVLFNHFMGIHGGTGGRGYTRRGGSLYFIILAIGYFVVVSGRALLFPPKQQHHLNDEEFRHEMDNRQSGL